MEVTGMSQLSRDARRVVVALCVALPALLVVGSAIAAEGQGGPDVVPPIVNPVFDGPNGDYAYAGCTLTAQAGSGVSDKGHTFVWRRQPGGARQNGTTFTPTAADAQGNVRLLVQDSLGGKQSEPA